MWPFLIIAALILFYFLARSYSFGPLRPLFTSLAFGLALPAGWFAFLVARQFLLWLRFTPEPITTFAFGFLAGLGVFLALRLFGHALVELLFDPDKPLVKRLFTGPAGMAFGLLASLLVMAAAATALRMTGTLAELRHTDRCITRYTERHAEPEAPQPVDPDDPPPMFDEEIAAPESDAESPDPPFLITWRNHFESSFPGPAAWLDRVDPLSPAPARNLAWLILISREPPLFAELAGSRRIVTLFTLPSLETLLDHPTIRLYRDQSRCLRLLRHPDLQRAARLPAAEADLAQIQPLIILPKILTPPTPEPETDPPESQDF